MTKLQRERLRRTFRPARLRLLFIGESPPASGRFFYRRDSGLYRAMRGAFQMADPSIDDENFLAVFQRAGCYLIDLCGEPVDSLDLKTRRAVCRSGEESVSRMIAELQPAMIATLLRSIEGNVARAIIRARWHGPVIHLPYPGRWVRHRKAFMNALVPAIGDLLKPDSPSQGSRRSTRSNAGQGRRNTLADSR